MIDASWTEAACTTQPSSLRSAVDCNNTAEPEAPGMAGMPARRKNVKFKPKPACDLEDQESSKKLPLKSSHALGAKLTTYR